ncbi:MAG TPA: DUF3617 family protein [Phenylobacterium sp.]|nr:DUF3617 family protein [Phenylobacterium sp.]
MTLLRFTAAAGLAALAVSACNRQEDAQPGAFPPEAAAPGPVAAAELPAPSPGLWEMKMTMTGAEAAATLSRVCYDAAIAREAGLMGRQAAAEANCQQSFIRQADGSLAINATCTGPDGRPMTTRVVARGDFSKAYTMEFTQDAEAAAGSMKIAAARLGDCPADFKPGDMEVNGMRMNIAGAAGAQPPAPAP